LLFSYKQKRKTKSRKIQDRKKIEEKKTRFIVFNNFSSCIIEHIIFNIITTITE